ncbi:interleukin 12 receptor, beta 2a, like isoform X2 [Lampris incognitus]|uniref:interleukin 12 receptor, beta 2a, like isoform X2 n=1 Tax=Lampris incognitus TaxID=2546036 RepID=UPI0024B4ED42|nr:interleukin 12 receptor, beta 2a, like isoform X2 [Lampris incognitus]
MDERSGGSRTRVGGSAPTSQDLKAQRPAGCETRWLLSFFLLSLPARSAPPGPPPPPSPPECHIPYEEQEWMVHTGLIHCTWEPGPDPKTPANYTLHWESANDNRGHVEATNFTASIRRPDFESHSQLNVWVQAKNVYGSANSPSASFNTADIMKLPQPKIISVSQDPLSISWKSQCTLQGHSEGVCEVRYRSEADQFWPKGEGGFHGVYYIDNPEPFTTYELQVRCSCADHVGSMSDWSLVQKVKSAEGAPVGKPNIWWDCGGTPAISKCVLMWKKLPRSQARGLILGYEVKWIHSNGTVLVINASTAETGGQLECGEMQCHLTSSPADVSEVYVSAYSARNSTLPAHLTMPGNYESYIGYKVSLFAMSKKDDSHQLSSAIGYVLQGTPPEVPSFKVDAIESTYVNLSWEPIPLHQRKGVILGYKIVVDNQKVYNVNVSLQHEITKFQLENLNPGQDYEVEIRAVTAAGSGLSAIVRFKTQQQQLSGYNIGTVFGSIVSVFSIVIVIFLIFMSKACPLIPLGYCEKVPDPRNSSVFQHMTTYQINEFSWNCVPSLEPNLQISYLEVMQIQPHTLKSCPRKASHLDGVTEEEAGDECSHKDRERGQVGVAASEEEWERTERRHGFGRQDYSKMIDSEEERDEDGEEERDDDLSSSDNDQSFSGYETHFMPTALEVL